MEDWCSACFAVGKGQELGEANNKEDMEYDRKNKHFTVDNGFGSFD